MPRNLLLADDSITIQKVVAITFATEDFKVTAVDNGEDALARARETRPDIILADVVMPRRNGYELCEAVKSDPALRGIPVLLLAGTFEAFDEARARSVRADGSIAKPFESQALISKVKELLEARPRAAGPAAEPRPAQVQRVATPVPQPAAGARPAPPAGPAPRAPAPAAPVPVFRPSAPVPGAPPPGARPAIPLPGARPQPGAPVPAFRPPAPGAIPRPPPPAARPPAPGAPVPGAVPAAPRPQAPQAPRAATPAVPPPAARPPAPQAPVRLPPAAPFVPPAPQAAPPAPLAGPPAPAPFGAPRAAPMAPMARPLPAGAEPPVRAPTTTIPPADEWLSVDVGVEATRAAAAATPLPTPRPAAPVASLDELDFSEEALEPAPPAPEALPEAQALPPEPIDLPELEGEPLELAPVHAFVPPPEAVGHAPAAPPPAAAATAPDGDGGEAQLRAALSRASREVIEKIAWEVVPVLAETIIREHLDRLVREKQGS